MEPAPEEVISLECFPTRQGPWPPDAIHWAVEVDFDTTLFDAGAPTEAHFEEVRAANPALTWGEPLDGP